MTQVVGTHTSSLYAVAKIYEGAMLGDSCGYVRGLVAGDKFSGHALEYQDNSDGNEGDKTVEHLIGRYCLQVTLTDVTVTDIGQPIYASDDATLTFDPTDNSFVGYVVRYVTTDTAVVEFRPVEDDGFGATAVRETKSDNYTIDAQDSGKIIYVDTDAKAITLPATNAGLMVTIVNLGSFGTIAVTINPNADDKIMGDDITSADNKDLINTKATAQRGDFVTLVGDGDDGWFITAMRGIWAREA